MENNLYDCFSHWFYADGKNKGSVFFYSDPHFGDLDCYMRRFPKEFIRENLCTPEAYSNLFNPFEGPMSFENTKVKQLDQMQINNINKKCTKRDTLVILGDVGDIECIKRLKAGRKILIMGNHDKGASNYKRNFEAHHIIADEEFRKTDFRYDNLTKNGYCLKFKDYCGEDGIGEYWEKIEDNHLFDEVYEGTLQISPKIILSHEPVEYRYCMNIHGHSHGANSQVKILEVTDDDTEYNIIEVNMCAEFINYTPVGINEIFDMRLTSKVDSIHAITARKRNAKRK